MLCRLLEPNQLGTETWANSTLSSYSNRWIQKSKSFQSRWPLYVKSTVTSKSMLYSVRAFPGSGYFGSGSFFLNDLSSIRHSSLICIYGRCWFAASIAADAPFLTLALWNDLSRWSSRDRDLSNALIRTLGRHACRAAYPRNSKCVIRMAERRKNA